MERTKGLVRVRARLPLKLPVAVSCRESAEYQWIERARLVDVNQFGAGFTLTRPIEVGRLVRLSIPLPHQLRCYDQFEVQPYSVWGLVRHIYVISQEPRWFRIGVAFIGKHAPASYEEDPTRRYEPLPRQTGQGSLWKLTRRPFAQKERREARLIIPLEVLVETLDENGNPAVQEHTVTEATAVWEHVFPAVWTSASVVSSGSAALRIRFRSLPQSARAKSQPTASRGWVWSSLLIVGRFSEKRASHIKRLLEHFAGTGFPPASQLLASRPTGCILGRP